MQVPAIQSADFLKKRSSKKTCYISIFNIVLMTTAASLFAKLAAVLFT
jgi:hypothetical protein